MTRKPKATKSPPRRSTAPLPARTIEWVIGAISAAIVLGMIVLILHEAVSSTNSPPLLTASGLDVQAAGDGYRVSFRISNNGELAAAGVVVEGLLLEGTNVVERSEATLDYVAAHASAQGGLMFSRDPAAFKLELYPRGYADP